LYNKIHAKEISKQRKFYYLTHKILFYTLHKVYYKKFLKDIKRYRELYNKLHLKEKQKYNQIYYKNNKIKINKFRNEYFKQRKKYDINFKILCNLRTRISETLKGNPKLATTMNVIGCSIEKLRRHLESQFTKGMSWSNYGKWHIDHIKPCAKFDLSKPSEQRKCFHYTNLQPLWAEENISKGDKYFG
jgi:prenyltransferase beta subunit